MKFSNLLTKIDTIVERSIFIDFIVRKLSHIILPKISASAACSPSSCYGNPGSYVYDYCGTCMLSSGVSGKKQYWLGNKFSGRDDATRYCCGTASYGKWYLQCVSC